MNTHDDASVVPGVPGKRLTRWMIGLMAIVLFAIIFFFANLARLESLRTETGLQWRGLASELDHRFRAAEKLADSKLADTAALTELHHLADQFRTATNMEEQFELADRTEQLLQQVDPAKEWLPAVSGQLSEVVTTYNKSVRQEHLLYDSTAGRFVNAIVSLAPRLEWTLFGSEQN